MCLKITHCVKQTIFLLYYTIQYMHLDMNTTGKVRFEKNAIIITHYEIRNARPFPPTPSTHCGLQP